MRNIGPILSGKIEEPLIDGDCVACDGGNITALRYAKDLDTDGATIHIGSPSIPGSGLIDKDVVLEAAADIDGGHTVLPDDQIMCLCKNCLRGIEIVHNGNERADRLAMRAAFEAGQPEHVIPGTDAPAGPGVQPPGILRMIAMPSSLGDVPAEIAFCVATGNTARTRDLDRGIIEAGKSAGLVPIAMGRLRIRHDGDRRRGPLCPKPQRAARRAVARNCRRLTPAALSDASGGSIWTTKKSAGLLRWKSTLQGVRGMENPPASAL